MAPTQAAAVKCHLAQQRTRRQRPSGNKEATKAAVYHNDDFHGERVEQSGANVSEST